MNQMWAVSGTMARVSRFGDHLMFFFSVTGVYSTGGDWGDFLGLFGFVSLPAAKLCLHLPVRCLRCQSPDEFFH